MSNKPTAQVLFAPRFTKDAKQLQKRYRHIDLDIEVIVERLEQGELPGDKIRGVGYDVYKVRAENRDAQRGKSGGYRIIYYVKLADLLVMLTIYSKSQRADISAEEIRRIIEEYNHNA